MQGMKHIRAGVGAQLGEMGTWRGDSLYRREALLIYNSTAQCRIKNTIHFRSVIKIDYKTLCNLVYYHEGAFLQKKAMVKVIFLIFCCEGLGAIDLFQKHARFEIRCSNVVGDFYYQQTICMGNITSFVMAILRR